MQHWQERNSVPLDPDHRVTSAQRLNSLLHPPKSLHFPKSSNISSIMKKPNIILYYLFAPAQGSKVPERASQKQPWCKLEIWNWGSVLSWGWRTWKRRALLSKIGKKPTLRKALELYFPGITTVWEGFEGSCTLLGRVQQPINSTYRRHSGQSPALAPAEHCSEGTVCCGSLGWASHMRGFPGHR